MTQQPDRPSESDIAKGFVTANLSRPRPLTKEQIALEMERCRLDPVYFINTYCQIYDSVTKSWIPFKMWEGQKTALNIVSFSKYTIVMKSRQLGLSWLLADVYPLWLMIFDAIAEVLLFSQRDKEATALLSRLKGTFERLPVWMKPKVQSDNDHEFRLVNGSGAQALPESTGGRSNAATYVCIDEGDYTDDLNNLIGAVAPTIDAGNNKLVVVSTVNDDTPGSFFKSLYKAAKNGNNLWNHVFLSWRTHPGMSQERYDAICATALATRGTLDKVYKEYPETEDQALSQRSYNSRYPPLWITSFSEQRQPLPIAFSAPVLPGLKLFAYPQPSRHYGIGLDPAGGFVDGDDSALCVVDADTFEQVAVLGGKIEPTQFANYGHQVSEYYNRAPILFELNNHGHATLSQLKERGTSLVRGLRRNGTASDPGWITTERSKHTLYDNGTKVFQSFVEETVDDHGDYHIAAVKPILFDFTTITQLSTINVNTLSAPEGQHDDYAMAWVLAITSVYRAVPSMMQQSYTGLYNKGLPLPNDKLAQLQRSMAITQQLLNPPTESETDTVDEMKMSDKEWLAMMEIKARFRGPHIP